VASRLRAVSLLAGASGGFNSSRFDRLCSFFLQRFAMGVNYVHLCQYLSVGPRSCFKKYRKVRGESIESGFDTCGGVGGLQFGSFCHLVFVFLAWFAVVLKFLYVRLYLSV